MKTIHKIIAAVSLGLIIPSIACASILGVQQGGTGNGVFQIGSCIVGNGINPLSTTTCPGGGTNYWTNSGINTTLNTGSNAQAGTFTATSTSGTSVFNGSVQTKSNFKVTPSGYFGGLLNIDNSGNISMGDCTDEGNSTCLQLNDQANARLIRAISNDGTDSTFEGFGMTIDPALQGGQTASFVPSSLGLGITETCLNFDQCPGGNDGIHDGWSARLDTRDLSEGNFSSFGIFHERSDMGFIQTLPFSVGLTDQTIVGDGWGQPALGTGNGEDLAVFNKAYIGTSVNTPTLFNPTGDLNVMTPNSSASTGGGAYNVNISAGTDDAAVGQDGNVNVSTTAGGDNTGAINIKDNSGGGISIRGAYDTVANGAPITIDADGTLQMFSENDGFSISSANNNSITGNFGNTLTVSGNRDTFLEAGSRGFGSSDLMHILNGSSGTQNGWILNAAGDFSRDSNGSGRVNATSLLASGIPNCSALATNSGGLLGCQSSVATSTGSWRNQTVTIASVNTYTPTASSTYEILVAAKVRTVSADTLTITCTYTSTDGTAATATFGAGLTTTATPTLNPDTIVPMKNTAITVVATVTGIGTINYDIDASILPVGSATK